MREVCLSRNWLMDRGFDVYDMAYPYDSTNASVKPLAAACGYNGARSGGQLLCDANHACAETVPPLDAYSLRTPLALETTTTLADMKAMVTNAETSGGGWVPLEIHDICDGPGDPLLPPAHCTRPASSPARSSTSSSTGSRARSMRVACRSRPCTTSSAAR